MNSAAPQHNRSDDLAWFRSSYSGSQGGDCVEVATAPSAVHIRDSKIPTGNVLTVSPATWSVFLERVTG
ncbi:DUF397 domain-containing protein [Streptomyces sp. DSM 40750]|uniref:DUF397 domain-containing protein n=1 Tax=Streptomyces sp. DSM 40750 TaxID=2801030 RepID=UPI00214CDBDA|nr:DUF397 domain-containing protein [Streptomyces sp. DSM 40750]UUU25124.1 DUF397 domain-containing protein [Streptomyces sp. DSM 40750]